MTSTLTHEIVFEGIGIHSGLPVKAVIKPALPGTGIIFRRTDLHPTVSIRATLLNVVDTTRCVTLGCCGATISTVEHLLAALWATNVDDIVVDVNAAELPIGDGSALCWLEHLEKANVSTHSDHQPPKKILHLDKLIRIEDGEIFVEASPSNRLEIEYDVIFDHPIVKTQSAYFTEGDDFSSEIAPARTFGFIEEVEELRRHGLAQGGSLDNTLVIFPDHLSSPMRLENELARHKLLDLLGDLSLMGTDMKAAIHARAAGHRMHIDIARQILKEGQ